MTRPFAAIERFFERLFERSAARLFHTPLQPIQIQRKLERAMDTGRVYSGDHAYVPNRYRVRLNEHDARAFDGYRQTIETELANALHDRARSRGYLLLARPVVTLESSARTEVSDMDVTAEILDPDRFSRAHAAAPAVVPPPTPVAAGAGQSLLEPSRDRGPRQETSQSASVPSSWTAPGETATSALEAAPLAHLEVRTHGLLVASVDFTGGTARIGRSTENDIVLVDDRVSRRHGQLSIRQRTLLYSDLASTNGSFVNGARVREVALGSGDVVQLGNSTLTVWPHV